MRPHVLLLLLLLAFATLGIFVCMVSAQGEIKSQVNPKDGLTYVWIRPGTFQMGCSPGDNDCGGDEKPARAVTITKGFWMGQTLVTQAAYQRVGNKNPSHFHGDRLPVERVTWFEAEAYCEAVQMRLPSEEEWEYAARAGTTTPRYGNLDDIAWYAGNSGNQTHEVGTKQPNAWMLYDMLGNVWEWSADWQIPGQYRMLRGGSRHGPKDTRVSYRNSSYPPNKRHNFIGFRCIGETVP